MKLVQLELTNIKSYQHEIIKFSDGINCILGLNGSGKSTIIESIGNVLFNYNQRTNNNIVRYNEKKGLICLNFIGADNKQYRIEKTIKARGANVKLIDLELKEVLFETVSDAYEFIKKVLNIPKEKSLPKLFEEIIAVPQGSFVNAFLDTPKIRKDNFDKLFELDIYKDLANQVKNLNDIVDKQYIYEIDKQIAQLTGKLTNYNEVCQETKETQQQLETALEQLKVKEDIYNKKEEEKKELDSQNNILNDLLNKKNELNINVVLVNQAIEELSKQIDICSKANEILLENELGYTLYKKNIKEYEINQLNYDKYISYQDMFNQKTLEKNNLINEYNSIQNTLHDIKVKIGNNKQYIIDTKEKISTLENKIIENRIILNQVKEQLSNKNEQYNQKILNYNIKIDKLNKAHDYLIAYNNDIDISIIIKQLEDINEKLIQINNNKQIINNLDKEKIIVEKDLENLLNNHSYMKDGMCPILKQKCLNIKDSDLSLEIDNLISVHKENINQINKKTNELLLENSKEVELLKEKEYLEFKNNNYNKDNEKYCELIKDLKEQFEELNDISKTNDKELVSKLLKQYNNLKDNFVDEELESLKGQEVNISNIIFSSQTNVNIDKKTIADKEEEIKQNQILVESNENKLKSLNNQILETNNRINDISKNIETYANSKTELEDNKKVMDKYKESYELYIQNQKDASNLSSNSKKLKEFDEKQEKLGKEINLINEQIKSIEEKHSKQLYEILQKEIIKLSQEISSLSTTINLKKERFDNLNKEITYLNSLIKEKEDLNSKLIRYQKLSEEYKIIRDIFNNLPRELSKQIRKYISTLASSLYRKISNENVRIDMLDDYEIILIDCLDEKKYKYLSQLSGGEQMSVAIAIRLAMLKQITGVQFYFMDEPTINLDSERRMMVAEVVKDISNELRQLYVISHDDTFESITDNTIKVLKVNNSSVIDR